MTLLYQALAFCTSRRNIYRFVVASCLTATFVSNVSAGDPAEAILIRVDKDNHPQVVQFDPHDTSADQKKSGLVVWADFDGTEQWAVISETTNWPPEAATAANFIQLAGATRSAANFGGGGADYALLASTIQLEPLGGNALTRGASFVTPMNNADVLNPKPTFRLRRTGNPNERIPAQIAVLFAGVATKQNEVLRIPFKEGQFEVAYAQIPNLPDDLKQGLSPGPYTLKLEGGLESSRFRVADPAVRQRIMEPVDRMAALLDGRLRPMYLQFAVENILEVKQEQTGRSHYLADALDILDEAPPSQLTPYLKSEQRHLRDWLANIATDPGYGDAKRGGTPPGGVTGIKEIDEVRSLIAAANWQEAHLLLDEIELPADEAQAKRVEGLINLYRGVLFAEAGVGQEDKATEAFDLALEQLESPADLFRAHNNLANHRLLLAQDQLNNHAFQIAAGVQQPFLRALTWWIGAKQHYDAALELAEELGDRPEQDAVRINLSRLYSLLADIVRTLDVPGEQGRQFVAMESAATGLADRYAVRVADAGDAQHEASQLVGAAQEIRAQLAYRAGEFDASRKHAIKAHATYVNIGYLAGVESIERLLGLNSLVGGDDLAAQQHLQISQMLAELLRARFPQDRVGLSRAGFFSRRSFVYEKLVELSIAEGNHAEALRFAELAKARAAQDTLVTAGIDAKIDSGSTRETSELLADWPEQVAAVEYFLGAERAWVFVINPQGQVKSYMLKDANGQPVASRDLIRSVREFLSGVEGQAGRMSQRILSGQGFDHAWQDTLFELNQTLLPAPVIQEMRAAEQVLVIPHHILHYFPFAALVTKRDEQERTSNEMVKPRFLLDEQFHLICSPSLATWDFLRHAYPATPITRASAIGIAEIPGAPPLPGVDTDLANFKSIFSDRLGTVFENSDAHEASAKQLLREQGVLLFATHGYNQPDRPLESFLLFLSNSDATAGAEDVSADGGGLLTAREIYSSQVRADLVVMSACYSGLGDRSPLPGDNLFGLQRAFLQSGAKVVVSGLWDVYDGTAPDLMRGFFERVADGQPASQALAESQRAFINQLRESDSVEPWLHPYFWAVYNAAGADIPIPHAPE